MRQQIGRLLILVVMFGFLVFASVPNSNAVALQDPAMCCDFCLRQYKLCIKSGRSQASCCAAYNECPLSCDPQALCPPGGPCDTNLSTVTAP